MEKHGILIPVGNHKRKKILLGAESEPSEYKELLIESFNRKFWIVNAKYPHINSEDEWIFNKYKGFDKEKDYSPVLQKIGYGIERVSGMEIAGISICNSSSNISEFEKDHPNIFARQCLTIEEAIKSRKEENTNLLYLREDMTTIEDAIEISKAWISTEFYSDKKTEKVFFDNYIKKARAKF
ncbi:MAG: RpiB/LacA/LacB family sugar-phosphate isomerase [Nanoarchaeota archaeon]|nr:RpiB/LacA/LacB family sugar-phosphate isomerase [Nanoarchaeota archaeon]